MSVIRKLQNFPSRSFQQKFKRYREEKKYKHKCSSLNKDLNKAKKLADKIRESIKVISK